MGLSDSQAKPPRGYVFPLRRGSSLPFPVPVGLPGSSADLSSRAISNYPGRPDGCLHPLLHRRFQASPLSGGLAAFTLNNEAESSSLALWLTSSPHKASPGELLRLALAWLQVEWVIYQVNSFQFTRSARLILALPELSENQKRFGLIGELLGQHGYQFRVWKKSEICAEPRLNNVKLVLRYRSVEVPAAERERIRRLFSTTAEICLQTFREINPQSTLRQVLDGTLFIDWWRPLTLDSRVSIAPIGRQVWPVSPPMSSLDSVEGLCH